MKDKFYTSRIEKSYILRIKEHLENYPIVIQITDKYDGYLTLVNNYKSFCNFFLKRLEHILGYYIRKPDEPKKLEFDKSLLDKLPEGKIKDKYKDELRQYEIDYQEYENDLELYNDAENAIKNKNGEIAFFIINRRKDYEYEGLEVHLMKYYE
jgi:hypothetical protein